MVGSSAASVLAGNDTNLCAGTSLSLNPSALSGSITWFSNKTGAFSNPNISNPVYTPAANEFGITQLVLQVLGTCGNALDTLNITYFQRPNPSFTIPSGTICKGSSAFNLLPQVGGGIFYGNNLTGNSFNPSTSGNYPIKYVVNNNGCADSSSKNIVVTDKPNPDFNIPSSSLCVGSAPITLTPLVAGGNFSGLGVNGNVFSPTTGGNYTVKYVVGNNGCLDSSSKIIIVIPKPIPSFSPTQTRVCELSAPILLNPLVLGGTFSGNAYISGNLFDPKLAGSYKLVYTIQVNGCIDSSSQFITVDPMPDASFTLSDTLFCMGDAPGNFTAAETGGVFNGMGVVGTQFVPSNAGVFVIKHRIEKGTCADSAELLVRVIENPVADFTYLPSNPIVNEPVQFTFTGQKATDFEWEFGNPILGSSDFENPSFTFFKSGNFAVKLLAFNETCSNEISKDVIVVDADTLFMPNVFTPNGDGLNETYGAVGFGLKEYNLFIYNRWGELLFTAEQINQKWDGRFREKDCAEGVYFFILSAASNAGRSYNLNGTLQLLR
jgi:gliding motility-associated-like protein